ncbi:dihydroorotate dehydrogenase electron transfer subunit [Bremerella alba]|uniref:Dihydroorotate dehydrogenase B (NAD(+)), electron transfer subunit n=1 Tax=Bremerella alba TaxID=980252 RepID=A0A7V9A805_9BACT|nr:dihydroorotate dehydrogenase electron transfer subunit [Bremerella alba]MBA2115970.1 Dihydroorotate dehydrogenase B (NAD(+)), electron transfer subunit [Bremerella alba]
MSQFQFQATSIVENVALAARVYRVRFEAPEIAAKIRPGQFVMVRIADCFDPLLGRAFALYDVVAGEDGKPKYVDVVYQVHGKLTSRLQKLEPGQKLEVWGPLGNGFTIPETDHLILVAGGIGQTPFLAVAKQVLGQQSYGTETFNVSKPKKVTLCYGARSVSDLAGLDDFKATGMELKICTEDGSAGHHGLVTVLLEQALAEEAGPAHVLCCGPEKMMEAVSALTTGRKIPCQVSLETPMACGIGICFTCVAPVCQEDGSWDYKRTCVEGPIFEASDIAWEHA